MKKLSIVVPVYNEEKGIRTFLDDSLLVEINEILGIRNDRKNAGFLCDMVEVILVDDGSGDDTLVEIKKTRLFHDAKDDIDIKIISFSRNFGKEEALAAGIRYATGDALVMIDADGQHPVEVISEMIKEWEQGALVVTAVRDENTTKHAFGSRLFYRIMRALGSNIKEGAMDFRLIDRVVADDYNQFTEHNRITRGLIDWLGYPQKYLEIKIKNREAGVGTYDNKKLMKLAVDSFVSMSRTPLLVIGYLGLFITVFAFLLGLFILIQQYILGDPLNLDWSGAVAVSVFVAFLVGLVLISQAITALYISQTHIEAKGRPLYVINRRRSVGLAERKGKK